MFGGMSVKLSIYLIYLIYMAYLSYLSNLPIVSNLSNLSNLNTNSFVFNAESVYVDVSLEKTYTG